MRDSFRSNQKVSLSLVVKRDNFIHEGIYIFINRYTQNEYINTCIYIYINLYKYAYIVYVHCIQYTLHIYLSVYVYINTYTYVYTYTNIYICI